MSGFGCEKAGARGMRHFQIRNFRADVGVENEKTDG